jgi:hypothetical protein
MERINLSTEKFFSLGKLKRSERGYCIGKVKQLNIELNQGGRGEEYIVQGVHDNGQLVVELVLGHVRNNVYTVQNSTVTWRCQGFNIMPLIYRLVMKKMKFKLQAGSMQSAGGRKLWVRLNETKGVKLTGFNNKRSKVGFEMVDSGEGELVTECGKSPYDSRSFVVIAEAI